MHRLALVLPFLCLACDDASEAPGPDVRVRDAANRVITDAARADSALFDGADANPDGPPPDVAAADAVPADSAPADAAADAARPDSAPLDSGPDAGPPAQACLDDMVLVGAGPFVAGLMNQPMNLPDFCIHTTEVSAAAYLGCVADAACDGYERWPACLENRPERPHQCDDERLDYPANWIDWFRADQYCRWIGARLPEPEEWEKAARGPDGREFPWGGPAACDRAQYAREAPFDDCVGVGPYGDEIAPVDAYDFVPSAYGAINLGGNVAEWTEFREDPTVLPADEDFAPARGGNYRDDRAALQGVRQNWILGAGRSSRGRGFRCAQDTFE